MWYVKALMILLLCLPTGGVLAQESEDEESTFQPRQVSIRARGVEVFPRPERRERLFALRGNRFRPFLAGQSDDGEFYYIYYFERGELKDGWVPLNQLDLDDWDYRDFMALPVILSDDLPPLPALDYVETAERYADYERD